MDGNTVVQGQYRVRGPGEHRRPVAFDRSGRVGQMQVIEGCELVGSLPYRLSTIALGLTLAGGE